MKKLNINLSSENRVQIQNIIEDEDIKEIKKRFKNLFNENRTISEIEVEIELKSGAKKIKIKECKVVQVGWVRVNRQT